MNLLSLAYPFFFGTNGRYLQSFAIGSLSGFAVAAAATASLEHIGMTALTIAALATLLKESAFYVASSGAYSFFHRRGFASKRQWATEMKILAVSCFAGAVTANVLRTLGHFLLMQTGFDGVVALFLSSIPVGLASTAVKMAMDAKKGIWLAATQETE